MLQLNLMRGDADDSSLVEQILDVVCKELDQASSSSACVLWWVPSLSFYELHSDLMGEMMIEGPGEHAGQMHPRMRNLEVYVVHIEDWWRLLL